MRKSKFSEAQIVAILQAKAERVPSWTIVLSWVRGICALISQRSSGAESAAALAASTDVPSEH